MKIIVVGANGQLGADVAKAFSERGDVVSSLTHHDLEIADVQSVEQKFAELRPEIVVNTAAMHHVESCEQDPQKAFLVNAVGAKNLSLAAARLDATIMHVSTDYVFDGNKSEPYIETDLPRPLNVYGNTKLAGEYFVRSTAPRHFVIRTSGLYGKNPCRGKKAPNFVELMLKLARERGEVRVVSDEVVTPTSTRKLAQQIVALSRSDQYGLYHATAEGSCSWFEFAKEIFDVTGTRVVLKTASSSDFPAKVARPRYSVLENAALKRQGLNVFRSWKDGLHDYLEVGQLCAVQGAV